MAKNISSRVGMKSVVQHLPDEALGLAEGKEAQFPGIGQKKEKEKKLNFIF